tara:strand:+ start:3324 stop:4595 length:1272 start_codon:yes stop_codon:yes gene_type:complete
MSETENSKNELAWSYDQDRQAAIDEVHARPALDIVAPATVLHIAFKYDPAEIDAVLGDIVDVKALSKSRQTTIKIDNIDITFELHTEFTACTFVSNNSDDRTKAHDLYRSILSKIDIKILSKCEIIVVGSAKEMAKHLPFGKRIYGGIMRGELQVHSALQLNEQGSITYAVYPTKNSPNELGRRIQRLYELETYRIMALIGLPLARRISTRLSGLEEQLNALTSKLEDSSIEKEVTDRDIFQELSNLSAKLDSLRSETRFRFSASNAYFEIIDARMKTLVEREHGDLQTISGFLRSRLEPARATIKSVERRQKILTEDITRALALLRTRIDIELSHGNQALLKSLDGRHKQQLLLSQAVESLSSIAITYYAVSLLSYFLKALDKSGHLPISSTIITALSVPVILFTVWFSIRKLRLKLHKSDD